LAAAPQLVLLDVALEPGLDHGGDRVGLDRRRLERLQPVLEAAHDGPGALAARRDGHLGPAAEAHPALPSGGVAGDDVEARRAVRQDAHAMAGKLWVRMEVALATAPQRGHLAVGEHLAARAALVMMVDHFCSRANKGLSAGRFDVG